MSSPADNSPAKIRPAWAAAGRSGFLPVNCRPGKTFLEGDPIMEHRQTAVQTPESHQLPSTTLVETCTATATSATAVIPCNQRVTIP